MVSVLPRDPQCRRVFPLRCHFPDRFSVEALSAPIARRVSHHDRPRHFIRSLWDTSADNWIIRVISVVATKRPSSPTVMRHSGIAVRCSALSISFVMFHSYYYFSSSVAFFIIAVSLGSLFQRIASIDDRFYLSRLNKLFDKN